MTRSYRREVDDLAARLVLEHAGALPPGQVIALVYGASRLVGTIPEERRLATCEAVVRRMLTDRLATESAATRRPA